MKDFRYYSLLILMLVFSTPALAQFSVGVIAGGNFGNLDLSFDGMSEDTNTRTSVGAGILVDYSLGPNMALSIQPMFLGKGAKQDETEDYYGSEFKLSYIEVPILFRYLIGSGNIRPFVEAGPSIGFLSSAEVEYSDGDSEDVKSDLKSTDMSVLFGVGVDVPVGNNSVFGAVRYAMGLSNIVDTADADGSEIKTKGPQVMFGFKLPLGNN